jgi:uncharacterized protein
MGENTVLKFQDLSFVLEDEELKINLLSSFYFKIPIIDLNSISSFSLKSRHEIIFDNISYEKAQLSFNQLMSKHILHLKNKLFNKPAVYLHKNSQIPLLGTNFIGLADRNTTCIEVKPITGCNINCVFCSVDEGIDSKKQVDFVVEKDFLVEEFNKLADNKNSDFIDIYINSHGEPTTYAPLADLIADLKKHKKVRTISLITNGTLVSKSKIDSLVDAGLTRVNLSLNALSEDAANMAAGTKINIEYVKTLAKYICQKCELVIAPVYLPGVNESEIEELIKFAKSLPAKHRVTLGIQNFMRYSQGRTPIKSIPMKEFEARLKPLEEKYDINLLSVPDDMQFIPTKPLKKPFRKNDLVQAQIVCYGRFMSDRIAVSRERCILIPNCDKNIGSKVRVKITVDKHNIFYGKLH